jgi:lipoate synthase
MGITVELLIPDFHLNRAEHLAMIADSGPAVIAHNMETSRASVAVHSPAGAHTKGLCDSFSEFS